MYVHSDEILGHLPGRGDWGSWGWSKDISKYLEGLLDYESVTKVTQDSQMETYPGPNLWCGDWR